MDKKPIIVYSAQKCGSTTVMRALESAGYPAHRAYAENIHTLLWRESKIITLVRDPVEHGISWMFEKALMAGDLIPGKFSLGCFPALTWFDDHFEHLFGFNPVDEYMAGCNYYMRDNHLIIRTDALSDWLGKALVIFAGRETWDVQHKARGAERFGEQYERFIKQVDIGKMLLDTIYSSDYCKAFWTDQERYDGRDKWIR